MPAATSSPLYPHSFVNVIDIDIFLSDFVLLSASYVTLVFCHVQHAVSRSDYDNVIGALPYLKVNRKAE